MLSPLLVPFLIFFTSFVQGQPSVIFTIPNSSPVAGTSTSISVTFLDSTPNALFSTFIVNGVGQVVDVVAVNQSVAASVWYIPLTFVEGTYRVRVDVVNSLATVNGQYLSPLSLTISKGTPLSICPNDGFRPQSASAYAEVQVTAPQAGALISLPPPGFNKPGQLNIGYVWKVESVESGWQGASAVLIDLLAIKDASIPGTNQVPTATIAQTSVVPPTVSVKSVVMTLPTTVPENVMGPSVVRMNYTVRGITKFSFSETFYLGKSCNGSLLQASAATTNIVKSSTTPSIIINTPDIPTLNLAPLIIGIVAGTVVVTVIIVLGIVWICQRRKRKFGKLATKTDDGYD
ncbi:hypothetical protein HK098_000986 [Nowakowskiella sp. JEL0407]|nr:hypothetical protein HK098_000986 [Nowakowskiella sp. JEL0407]